MQWSPVEVSTDDAWIVPFIRGAGSILGEDDFGLTPGELWDPAEANELTFSDCSSVASNEFEADVTTAVAVDVVPTALPPLPVHDRDRISAYTSEVLTCEDQED